MVAGFAAGFALEVAGTFAIMKISDAIAKSSATPTESKTAVTILLGGGTETAGGMAPHVALWDDSKNIPSGVKIETMLISDHRWPPNWTMASRQER